MNCQKEKKNSIEMDDSIIPRDIFKEKPAEG